MSPELDKLLCKKFPKLYRDRNASAQTTCMCWGFPGDGWFLILWNLSIELERLIEAEPVRKRRHYRASQVKEKFGTLRFYMQGSTPEMEMFIDRAEALSAVTCETCGAAGKRRGGGWIVTACDLHAPARTKEDVND